VKGTFSHFASELKKNGDQAVIFEISKAHPQLMKSTCIWWKKLYAQVGKCPYI